MKSKLLFRYFILFFLIFISGFSLVQESYLPTAINLSTSSKFDKELLLNLRASFGSRKIKTINKEEALELQNEETRRVLIPYLENLKRTGASVNFEDQKTYMSLDQHKVCNSLTVDIRVTEDGIINDTVKWMSRTLPFDFQDTKKSWHLLILDSTSKTSISKITQTITDRIITSNVLVKQ